MMRATRLPRSLLLATAPLFLVSTCLGQPEENTVTISGTVSGPAGPSAEPLAGVTVRIVLERTEQLLGVGDTDGAGDLVVGEFGVDIDKTFIDEPLVIDFISADARYATQFVKFLSRNEGQQINKILPLDQPLNRAAPLRLEEDMPSTPGQEPGVTEEEDGSMRPMDAALKDALGKLATFEEMFRRIQAKRTRDQYDDMIITSVQAYLNGWTNPTTLVQRAPASSYNRSLYSAVTAKLAVIQSLYRVQRPPTPQCNCCRCRPCRPVRCKTIYRRWSCDDDD